MRDAHVSAGFAVLHQRRGWLATNQVTGPGWEAAVAPTNAERFQDGDPVIIALRPENVRIAPATDSTRQANRIKGTLRDVIYLGVEFRLTITLQDNSLIQVRSRDFTIAESLKPGTAVIATWATGDAIHVKA